MSDQSKSRPKVIEFDDLGRGIFLHLRLQSHFHHSQHWASIWHLCNIIFLNPKKCPFEVQFGLWNGMERKTSKPEVRCRSTEYLNNFLSSSYTFWDTFKKLKKFQIWAISKGSFSTEFRLVLDFWNLDKYSFFLHPSVQLVQRSGWTKDIKK